MSGSPYDGDMTDVLVVEDDPTVAEVLGLYLGRAGLRVRHTTSGESRNECRLRSPIVIKPRPSELAGRGS